MQKVNKSFPVKKVKNINFEEFFKLKTRKFVLKTRSFIFKMMDSAGPHATLADLEGKRGAGAIPAHQNPGMIVTANPHR